MFGIDLESAGTAFTVAVVYGGMVIAALWLAMILWTYRDMRARSRDFLAQMLVSLMVAILTFPGLLIYTFLRPRETLSESYERSLEEEALLQEIEEKPTCPGCGQRVSEEWQVCPQCHTRLKKQCQRCQSLLELSWGICPVCASPQQNTDLSNPDIQRGGDLPEKRISVSRRNPTVRPERTAGSLEFVDGEDY